LQHDKFCDKSYEIESNKASPNFGNVRMATGGTGKVAQFDFKAPVFAGIESTWEHLLLVTPIGLQFMIMEIS